MGRTTSAVLQAIASAHRQDFLSAGRHSGGGSTAPVLELVKTTAFSILEVVLISIVGYIMARRGVIDKKTQTVSTSRVLQETTVEK